MEIYKNAVIFSLLFYNLLYDIKDAVNNLPYVKSGFFLQYDFN
jgi:hypothetical protein